jgi:hypothetical protein
MKLALPAGFPPASFRLEGGCLMYFDHGSKMKWSEWQDLERKLVAGVGVAPTEAELMRLA